MGIGTEVELKMPMCRTTPKSIAVGNFTLMTTAIGLELCPVTLILVTLTKACRGQTDGLTDFNRCTQTLPKILPLLLTQEEKRLEGMLSVNILRIIQLRGNGMVAMFHKHGKHVS